MRLHRTKWRASANSRWSAWALCGVHLPFEAQRENRSRQQNRRGKRLVHVPYSSNHSTLSTRSVAALRFSKAGDPLSQSGLLIKDTPPTASCVAEANKLRLVSRRARVFGTGHGSSRRDNN